MIPIEKKNNTLNGKKVNGNAKYAEWITEDGLTRVQGWARDGLIESQIAQNMGINVGTLSEWKKRFPELREAIKKGKAPVDIAVENALLKKALGYDYEETVTEMYRDEDGVEKTHIRKHKRHMPPDVTAQIYWLKNRQAEKWRDKRETQIEAKEAVKVVIDV